MKKQLFFYFLVCLLILDNNAKAQQEKGQITINAGVGYSPEFDGNIDGSAGPLYPVGINGAAQEGFGRSSIIPNINGTVDYGISNICSIGLASSYQSEEVTYIYPYTFFDKVTRINLTARILGHLNKNHSNFDHYIGIRFGYNYWGDIPPPNPGYPPRYFLNNPNTFVPGFQFFYGMRIYFTHNVGIHFEVGIGQPYLAEAGLTFKIDTRKSIAAPPNNKAGQEIK